jgi:Fic family protein
VNEASNDAVERRDSVAREPELITDPVKLAEAEAANGLRQFDAGKAAAQEAIDRQTLSGDYRFRLRPSLLLMLHREALAGISLYAGNYRPSTVKISESKHDPPEAHRVPELIEDLCEYVNEKWNSATPLHLAAFVMWRLNWIHPFADGNGRTSRISSYVVLSIKSGFLLPGSPTIPDQIVNDRSGYFKALDDADSACREGRLDVSTMETLLAGMLARQLAAFYQSAGGKLPDGVELNSL